ncbi:DUF1524 domain-containing protein [Nocardioides sp.]|uniref:GmrSD restriction endonuclease domain-containing protein n=1 Tax=Nocardioides sp. TaxID=35761 RepID=UPI0035288710
MTAAARPATPACSARCGPTTTPVRSGTTAATPDKTCCCDSSATSRCGGALGAGSSTARSRDPYTGRRLTWRQDGFAIQVDHVYPLAAAWAAGAWAWPQRRRLRFANDVRRELLAVSADANQAKGAATPSQWLPPRGRCGYLGAYLRVAVAYDLPITAADARVVRRVATRC